MMSFSLVEKIIKANDLLHNILQEHLEKDRILTPEQIQKILNTIVNYNIEIRQHFQNKRFVRTYGKTKRFRKVKEQFEEIEPRFLKQKQSTDWCFIFLLAIIGIGHLIPIFAVIFYPESILAKSILSKVSILIGSK